MTDTFEIKFVNDNNYRIIQQPERDFTYDDIFDEISIYSMSFPASNINSICLCGSNSERDDYSIKLFPKHLKALEEFCKYKQWRFIACI